MKQVLFFLTAVLLSISMFAQIPQKMSYQAVIRDGGEALIKNQQVGMKISILQGSQTGTAVYVETQTATTNTNGLVSLKIGDGTVVTGNFSTINWSTGSYYIKTETDPTGGTDYTIVGTSELMSVPYALYSSGVPYGGASSDVNLGTHSLTANSLTLGGVTYPNNAGTSGYFLSTNGDGIAYWAAVNSGIPYTGAYRSVDLGVHGLTAAALNVGAVTYPNAHGTSGQVLSTTGSGILSWTTPSTTATAYSGILPVTNGGTGTTTSTGSGNVVLSSSPTLVSPALGTPSSGVATYLTGLPLTTGVTGTLPVANGGTGAITKAAAFDALSPMTTPGDIIYGGTSGIGSRLGHGTSGQVLSTTGSGTLSWTTPDSISIGTIGGSSNAKGATVTSGVLSLTPADVTNGGIVTTETQTFAGDKTVNGNFTISKFLSGTTLDKSITTPGSQSGAYTTCWQSFTAGASGFLSKVSMDFINCAGTGTLFIYGGRGNKGTVLTSQSFSVSTIGNEIFQDFLLNSPVYVTNGNEYTMAFVCSSGTINEVVSADFYPGSTYLFYNGSSWPSSPSGGRSILFKTYLSQESGGNITAAKSITAGAVTYPNAHGTNGQVLSTTGSGTLSWTTPSTTATAYSGILPVTNGGTGTTTSTGSGNVVLSSSPTLVSPALGTPSSGVATYLTGLPLTTGVTGTLPVANGGTGQITKAAAFDALSPMTTPGDIIYGGTSGTGSRLGHGTSGQVLSTTGSGTLSWTTPASISVGAIGGSSNANGTTLTSGVLSLTPADVTNGGIVTTGTQTFAGNKTVNGNLTVDLYSISGPEAIDVNNTSGAMTGTVGSTQWQSFVAGQTGVLTKIVIEGNGSAGIRTGTLTIFAGSGVGGTQLSTQSVALPPNNGLFDLVLSSTVNVVQGQTYTFEIADPSGGNFIATATALSGTSYYSNSYGLNPGWSLAFNTLVIPGTRSGNITAGGTITAGAVTYPNAHGTSGQVLSTNGSGTLSWVNPQSGPTGAQGATGSVGATGASGQGGVTQAGLGILVTGTGTSINPYIVSSKIYTIGLWPELGGYVFKISADGRHGLVAETQDQSASSTLYLAQDAISNPVNHSANGQKFMDWRLPTKYELNEMYLQKSAIGGFVFWGYWSSTEGSYNFAWIQDFSNGAQSSGGKNLADYVRAVRAF